MYIVYLFIRTNKNILYGIQSVINMYTIGNMGVQVLKNTGLDGYFLCGISNKGEIL